MYEPPASPSWAPDWVASPPVPGPVPPAPVGPAPTGPTRSHGPLVLALVAVVAGLAGALGAGLLVTALFLGSADDIGRELGEQVGPAVADAVGEGLTRGLEDGMGALSEDIWSSQYGAVEQSPATEPGELGPDPVLDAYAADCFTGDLQACDSLYFESPPLSDYEEYGAACGGRVKPYSVMTCTDLD